MYSMNIFKDPQYAGITKVFLAVVVLVGVGYFIYNNKHENSLTQSGQVIEVGKAEVHSLSTNELMAVSEKTPGMHILQVKRVFQAMGLFKGTVNETYDADLKTAVDTFKRQRAVGALTKIAIPAPKVKDKVLFLGGIRKIIDSGAPIANISLANVQKLNAGMSAIAEFDATPEWSARFDSQAVYFKNKYWMIGGKSVGNDCAFSGNVWNSNNGDTWASVTATAPFSTHKEIQAVVDTTNNRLYVLGGVLCSGTAGRALRVWYTDNGTTWTAVPFAGASNYFPLTRFSAVSKDGALYVFGGSALNTPHAKVVRLNVGTGNAGWGWTVVNPSTPFGYRNDMVTATFGGYMYAIGGHIRIPQMYFANNAYANIYQTVPQGATNDSFPAYEYYFDDIWRSTNGVTWEYTGQLPSYFMTQTGSDNPMSDMYGSVTLSDNFSSWFEGGKAFVANGKLVVVSNARNMMIHSFGDVFGDGNNNYQYHGYEFFQNNMMYTSTDGTSWTVVPTGPVVPSVSASYYPVLANTDMLGDTNMFAPGVGLSSWNDISTALTSTPSIFAARNDFAVAVGKETVNVLQTPIVPTNPN